VLPHGDQPPGDARVRIIDGCGVGISHTMVSSPHKMELER
jgi:hypothetical protein